MKILLSEKIALLLEQTKQSKENKKLTVEFRDYDNRLYDLLKYIMDLGNIGHTFEIVVDTEGESKKFLWDGDGPDRIFSIK